MSSIALEIKHISKLIVVDLGNCNFQQIQYKVTPTPRIYGARHDAGFVNIHFSNIEDNVLDGFGDWLFTRIKKRHISQCVVNDVKVHLDRFTVQEFLNLIKDTQKGWHEVHDGRPESPRE